MSVHNRGTPLYDIHHTFVLARYFLIQVVIMFCIYSSPREMRTPLLRTLVSLLYQSVSMDSDRRGEQGLMQR